MASREGGKDLRFGFCGNKPASLQVFNSSGMFVVFMFLSNMFLSMTSNGLVGVALSSLEKRFEMSSSQSSWIASSYEIAAIPAIIAVSIFGNRIHRPRLTAIGLLVTVIGCLLFVVPHFATGVYHPGSTVVDKETCVSDAGNNSLNVSGAMCCPDGGGPGKLSWYLYIFVVAQILQGMCTVPLQTIGVTFLDDVVTKQKFSLYIAIYFAGGVLGPALGFVAGGFLLDLFTDFQTVDVTAAGLSPAHPRWVGAWWLGFLFSAICLFFSTIPFFGYCNDLPGAADIRAARVSEAHGEALDALPSHVTCAHTTYRPTVQLLWQVISNPCFFFICLFFINDAFTIAGFANFGPKYLEQQFSISSSAAGGLFGAIAISGGIGGSLAGGFLIKRFNLRVVQILQLELVLTIGFIVTGCCFFITCNPIDFAGVSKNYKNASSGPPTLISPCNADCGCEGMSFNPVCGVDNTLYFSACHAGCVDHAAASSQHFGNCSCVSAESSPHTMATHTGCSPPACTLMPLFVILFFIVTFIIFLNTSMNCTLTLRVVSKDTRALAIGIQGLLTKLFGTFPGPLAFGAAFDSSCVMWQETRSGDSGACLRYDNHKMAAYMLLVGPAPKVVFMWCLVLAWKLYKPPTTGGPVMGMSVGQGGTRRHTGTSFGIDSSVFEGDGDTQRSTATPTTRTEL